MASKRTHTYVPTPVTSYALLADHYRKRVEHLANETVDAMAKADIERAVRTYEQGVFAQQCLQHYSRMASCVGDLDLNDPKLLPSPEDEK